MKEKLKVAAIGAGTIREGYISTKMCLAAQESIESGKVVDLDLKDN